MSWEMKRTEGQMENITLEVVGDADRFACEFFLEKFRTVLDRRLAHGKNIRDERNSGCDD